MRDLCGIKIFFEDDSTVGLRAFMLKSQIAEKSLNIFSEPENPESEDVAVRDQINVRGFIVWFNPRTSFEEIEKIVSDNVYVRSYEVVSKGEEQSAPNEIRFLTFSLGNDTFGIKADHILEVLKNMESTQVSRMPEYYDGMANYKTQVIPAIDGEKRLKIDEVAEGRRNLFVVFENKGKKAALNVKSPIDIVNIPENRIFPIPGINDRSGFLKGGFRFNGQVAYEIDCQKLFEG